MHFNMFAHFKACLEFVKTKVIIAVKNVENIMDTNNNAKIYLQWGTGF